MSSLTVGHNSMSGTLPTEIGSASKLQACVWFEGNDFTGPVPTGERVQRPRPQPPPRVGSNNRHLMKPTPPTHPSFDPTPTIPNPSRPPSETSRCNGTLFDRVQFHHAFRTGQPHGRDILLLRIRQQGRPVTVFASRPAALGHAAIPTSTHANPRMAVVRRRSQLSSATDTSSIYA